MGGLPDLIVKLKDGYGILDFKSTSELDKSQNYKYQLESYAQILENPNNKTPKLSPVLLIGLIQFTPKEIISHENNSISQKWKMQYSLNASNIANGTTRFFASHSNSVKTIGNTPMCPQPR